MHKWFGDLHVLKDIDLDIERGEIFALLGPNGAGKTTLISAVCNLIRTTSGDASLRYLREGMLPDGLCSYAS